MTVREEARRREEAMYIHVVTGEEDTAEGWISSYPEEEIQDRGLTAEQAFAEDEGKTLLRKE